MVMTANVPRATASVGSMDVGKLSDNFYNARDYAGLLHWEAEDLAGLAENDRERDAIEKADQDWPGEKVSERPQSQKACGEAEQSGEQREHDGERGISSLVAWRERSNACCDQGTGGGVGPDD